MTRWWRDREWRRSLLACVFAAAGAVLTGQSLWLAHGVMAGDWPAALAAARLRIIGGALYASLALTGLVLTGLSMTVALRQVSARFMGADFSAAGGEDAP